MKNTKELYVRANIKGGIANCKILVIHDKIQCEDINCIHKIECDECIFADKKYSLTELRNLGRIEE